MITIEDTQYVVQHDSGSLVLNVDGERAYSRHYGPTISEVDFTAVLNFLADKGVTTFHFNHHGTRQVIKL